MDGLGVDEVVEENVLRLLGIILPEAVGVLDDIPRTAEVNFITRLDLSRFNGEARHYTYTCVDFLSRDDTH
jgi:hypothetical protein